MSLFNREDSYEAIAKRIFTVIKEINNGNLCEAYLEVELYGLLEKNEKNWIIIRVSEDVYQEIEGEMKKAKSLHGSERHMIDSIKKGYHAEHVLPRAKLKQLLIERFVESKETFTEKDVEDFLRNNCKGVLITHEECARLDEGVDNLKDRMPENWKLGDCVEKRLEAKNIKIHDEYFTVTDF